MRKIIIEIKKNFFSKNFLEKFFVFVLTFALFFSKFLLWFSGYLALVFLIYKFFDNIHKERKLKISTYSILNFLRLCLLSLSNLTHTGKHLKAFKVIFYQFGYITNPLLAKNFKIDIKQILNIFEKFSILFGTINVTILFINILFFNKTKTFHSSLFLISISSVIATIFSLRKYEKTHLLKYLILSFILFLPALITFRRSCIISFLIFLFILFLKRKKYLKYILFYVVEIAIFLAFSTFNLKNFNYIKRLYNKNNFNQLSSGRYKHFIYGVNKIKTESKKNILTGYGYFNKEDEREYESIIFLSLFLNGGILNLFLFLFEYIFTIYLLYKSRKNYDLYFLTNLGLMGLNSLIFRTYKTPLLFFFLFILGYVEGKINRGAKLPP